MNALTDEQSAALRPIASLISKSEKALTRLAPGTWQHTMLQDNLAALRLASSLLKEQTTLPATSTSDRNQLQATLPAFASMISKTAEAQTKFSPGTSQYTLLRNRLQALRLAEALIKGYL